MEFTVIILSGGKSSRMGQDKSLMYIEDDKVIEILVRIARRLTENIIIVTNHFERYKYLETTLVADIRRDVGPLAGIEAGLSVTKTEKNLVIACDMPFVSYETAMEILAHADDCDAVIPLINGQRHPLFALYKKSTLPILSKTLDNGDRKILLYLDKINTKWITEKELNITAEAFFNMNTPQEFEKALEITAKKRKSEEVNLE